MKIGIILHPYGEKTPGGLPRIIFGWAQALLSVDQKNEYIIFVKERPAVLPDLPGKNWRLEVLGNGRFWLDRLKKAPGADVYLFNTPVLPFFWRPPKSAVIALDYPYKYLKARGLKEKLFRIFLGWYHRRSLRHADHIIAVSHSTKNDTVKFFGVSPEKISVVYHGFKKICELPEKSVDAPERFFFFAGTMKERKNVFNIIKGFEIFLKSDKTKTKLFLGGRVEGEYYQTMLRYVESHGLTDEVLFPGYFNENELSYIYKRALALVFPSIVEGTGFPILEAMGCGVPVITSNIFGPAELGANDSAILVDPYSPEEIAVAMGKISGDEVFRKDLIEKGREQCRKFSWENTGRETLKILEDSATKKPRVCFIAHNANPHNGGGVLVGKTAEGIRTGMNARVEIISTEFSNTISVRAILSGWWFLSPRKIIEVFRAVRGSDIVHAFDIFPYGFIAALFSLAIFRRPRLIITAVGTGSVVFLYHPVYLWMCKFAAHRADKIIAISNFTKREVLKKISGLKIDVIHPGADLELIRSVASSGRSSRFDRYKPYIMSVGSLRFRKGYRFSIDAFAAAAKKFPDLKYLIIGKKYTDKELNILNKKISDYGLLDRIFILQDVGGEEELAECYKNAELFVLMSLNSGHDIEGFGMVFVEAAAAGLPVVGSRDCGAEDAVWDSRNGYLVRERDVEGWAAAIEKIIGDKETRQKMSSASLEFSRRFDWNDKNEEYARIYKKELRARVSGESLPQD